MNTGCLLSLNSFIYRQNEAYILLRLLNIQLAITSDIFSSSNKETWYASDWKFLCAEPLTFRALLKLWKILQNNDSGNKIVLIFLWSNLLQNVFVVGKQRHLAASFKARSMYFRKKRQKNACAGFKELQHENLFLH